MSINPEGSVRGSTEALGSLSALDLDQLSEKTSRKEPSTGVIFGGTFADHGIVEDDDEEVPILRFRALIDYTGNKNVTGAMDAMPLRAGAVYLVDPKLQPPEMSEEADFLWAVDEKDSSKCGYVLTPDSMLAEEGPRATCLVETIGELDDEISPEVGEIVQLLRPFGEQPDEGWALASRDRRIAQSFDEKVIGLIPMAKLSIIDEDPEEHNSRLVDTTADDVAAVNLKMQAPYGNRHAFDAGTNAERAVSMEMVELFAALDDPDDDIKADALVQLGLLLDMADPGEEFEAFCALIRDFNVIGSVSQQSPATPRANPPVRPTCSLLMPCSAHLHVHVAELTSSGALVLCRRVGLSPGTKRCEASPNRDHAAR